MKTIIHIFLVLAIGCKEQNPSASVLVDTTVDFIFIDGEGNNILTDNNGVFSLDELELYYYDSNMKYVHFYQSNLTNPNFIFKPLNENGSVTINPVFGKLDGTYIEGGKSTTYLDFGNGDIDTIQVSGKISKAITQIEEVWYNGEKCKDGLLYPETIIK